MSQPFDERRTTADFFGTQILVSGEGDNEFPPRGDRRGAPLRIVTVEPLHLQFLQEGSPEFNDVPPFDRFGPCAHQLQGDELNQWTNWFESDVNVGRGGAAQQPPSNASTQFPIERAGGRRNITSAEQAHDPHTLRTGQQQMGMATGNAHHQLQFAGPSVAFQQQRSTHTLPFALRQPRPLANTFTAPHAGPVSPCPAVLQLLDAQPMSKMRDDDTKSEPDRQRPRWWVEYNDEEKELRGIKRRKNRGGNKERTKRDPVTGNFYNIKKKPEGQ